MKCDKGWEDGNGECCCNCEFNAPVNAHPWNVEGFRGGIGQAIRVNPEVPLMVCTVQLSEKDEYRAVIAMTREHGMCEMHTFRKK